MKALVSESLAYDVISRFTGKFSIHILPEHIQSHSVACMDTELRREFGGCAGNIAYTLKLLADEPLPVGAAGKDFRTYTKWLEEQGITREHIKVLENVYTAQAYINTD